MARRIPRKWSSARRIDATFDQSSLRSSEGYWSGRTVFWNPSEHVVITDHSLTKASLLELAESSFCEGVATDIDWLLSRRKRQTGLTVCDLLRVDVQTRTTFVLPSLQAFDKPLYKNALGRVMWSKIADDLEQCFSSELERSNALIAAMAIQPTNGPLRRALTNSPGPRRAQERRLSLLAQAAQRVYLRQEFDYIRSALAPEHRREFEALERVGRSIPLTGPFRQQVVAGLAGWEKKMEAVGVMDDLGIAAALHGHLAKLTPEYRSVLVDEVQDLGTLELAIIRRLTKEGENDLFLCGDTAQTVQTKHADLKAAGINVIGRSSRLNQNYRNSRQILEAAHAVLSRGMEAMPGGNLVGIELLRPEFANFSTAKPMLMREASLVDELSASLAWLRREFADAAGNQRACIAICGYSASAVADIAKQLGLPPLREDVDLTTSQIFISDLDHTKGFEFDTVPENSM